MCVLSGGEWCGGVVQPEVPGQQLCDAVHRMVGDALQHLAQVGLGIEAVQLGGSEQAIESRGSFPTGVGAGEQVILPIMCTCT
jgi:hypothetical protein